MWARCSTSWESSRTPGPDARAVRSDDARQPAAPRRSTAPRAADATSSQADAPVTFTELVEAAGLARSTTSRLLAALERTSCSSASPTGDVRRRSRCSSATPRATTRDEQLARLARPGARARSASETGETVNLAVPSGDRVVQIAQVDSTYLLGARDWTDVDVPAHCSALGKVLLRVRRACDLPRGRLEPPTEHTLAHRRRPATRDLASVRDRGYAITRDELEIGLTGVAAPVRGPDGDVSSPRSASPDPAAGSSDSLDELGRSSSTARRCALRRSCGTASSNTRRRPDERRRHDTRRDPQGPLRRDAGRQRAARPRADPRGAGRWAWSRSRCSSTR